MGTNDEKYGIVLPEFTAAFTNLLTPKKKKKPDEKDKYGMTMLFDPGENLTALKALGTAKMTELFGAKENWPAGFKKPWRDQWEKCKDNPAARKKYDGFQKGALFANCATNIPPEIVDEQVQPIISGKKVYSGCRMIAHVTLFWYDNEGFGLGLSLNTAQKVGDGKPLGGSSVSAASVFSPKSVDASKDASDAFDDDEEDPMG